MSEVSEIARLKKELETTKEELEKSKLAINSARQEAEKNKLAIDSAYVEILNDISGGKTIEEIRAKHILKDSEPVNIFWKLWKKAGDNLSTITSIVVALSAIIFGLTQCSQKSSELEITRTRKDTELNIANKQLETTTLQKNTEIELTKVKALGDLVDKLSSKDPAQKKYATFAAMNLGIGDFEKMVVTSISDSDTDAFNNIETLELLLEKIKTDDLKLIVQKKLSKIYTKKAEDSSTSSPNNSESYANTAIKNFPNAIAQYRLGEFERVKNPDNALDLFKIALKDLENGQSDFVLDLRPDIKISIYERMGQTADSADNTQAREYYKSALDLLDPSVFKDSKDNERRKILEGCIKPKAECKFK